MLILEDINIEGITQHVWNNIQKKMACMLKLFHFMSMKCLTLIVKQVQYIKKVLRLWTPKPLI
jgi:hypothetical protein